METVSGVAGLIKVVLMMQHDEIRAANAFRIAQSAHQTRRHAARDPDRSTFSGRATKRRRIAGVSSFGFGGTNTHLIVEAGSDRAATVEHNGAR